MHQKTCWLGISDVLGLYKQITNDLFHPLIKGFQHGIFIYPVPKKFFPVDVTHGNVVFVQIVPGLIYRLLDINFHNFDPVVNLETGSKIRNGH